MIVFVIFEILIIFFTIFQVRQITTVVWNVSKARINSKEISIQFEELCCLELLHHWISQDTRLIIKNLDKSDEYFRFWINTRRGTICSQKLRQSKSESPFGLWLQFNSILSSLFYNLPYVLFMQERIRLRCNTFFLHAWVHTYVQNCANFILT